MSDFPSFNDTLCTLGTLARTHRYSFWCYAVLPLVYDDSLTYLENMCKVVEYLNSVIDDVHTLTEGVECLNDFCSSMQTHLNSLIDDYNTTIPTLATITYADTHLGGKSLETSVEPIEGSSVRWDSANNKWVYALGTGDFMADGSVPMTGDLQMGGNKITNADSITLSKDGDGVVFYQPSYANMQMRGEGVIRLSTQQGTGMETYLEMKHGGLTYGYSADGTLPQLSDKIKVNAAGVDTCGGKLLNVQTPTNTSDGVNKQYADGNIAGRPVTTTAQPANGQILKWSTGDNKWLYANETGGGGGTGNGDFMANGSIPMTGNLNMNYNDVTNTDAIYGNTNTGVLTIYPTPASTIEQKYTFSNTGLDMSGKPITSLHEPVNPTDAATKQYVDDQANNQVMVTLTRQPEGSTYPFTADMTYLEIKAKVDGGANVMAKVTDNGVTRYFHLGEVKAEGITFYLDELQSETYNNNKTFYQRGAMVETGDVWMGPAKELFNEGKFIKRDGSNAFTGNVNAGGFRIGSVAEPSAPSDAATKTYVDNAVTTGGSGVSIVQEAGTSTTDVMSQNASTEAFVPKSDVFIYDPNQSTTWLHKIPTYDNNGKVVCLGLAAPDQTSLIAELPVTIDETNVMTFHNAGADVPANCHIAVVDPPTYTTHVTNKVYVDSHLFGKATNNLHESTPTNGQTITWDGTNSRWVYSTPSAGGGSNPESYVLPMASANALGGVKAAARNASTDTQEVKIDSTTGKLYVQPPGTGGGGSTTVVQTTGTSTTAVMSQKAVTDTFLAKANINDTKKYVTAVSGSNPGTMSYHPLIKTASEMVENGVPMYDSNRSIGALRIIGNQSLNLYVNATNVLSMSSNLCYIYKTLDMSGNNIQHLNNPLYDNDASTKIYVNGYTATALPASGTALAENTVYTTTEAVNTYQFTPPARWAHGTFTTGATPAITFASGSKFINAAPTFEANTTYEFDVYNSTWVFNKVVTA